MRSSTILAIAILSVARVATGQTVNEQVAAGDRDHAERHLDAALQHYDSALALDPSNYVALAKAGHDAIALGEFDENHKERDSLYERAEQYARRAVAANPSDAEGHFELAVALGRSALTKGARERIDFAREVREQALDALRIDPNHAGAKHVLGEWNAEVMRLNGLTRMIARGFLGGKVFGEASWDNAQRFLEESVALEPDRITHHLDLAAVYADRGNRLKAIEQYEWIARAPVIEYNDARYKRLASAQLKKLQSVGVSRPAIRPDAF